MALAVTTDAQLEAAPFVAHNTMRKLMDPGRVSGGNDAIHTKAREAVLAWLRVMPERIVEADLTNPSQYRDAQLLFVLHLLFRRAGQLDDADRHHKYFLAELARQEPEVDNTVSQHSYAHGIIFERG